MNKTEAANYLGVSVRAVERYAAADKLPARYVRGKTGQVLDFEETDLKRFKTSLETPTPKGAVTHPTTPDEPRQAGHDNLRQMSPTEARQTTTTALARIDEPQQEVMEVNPALQLLVQAFREAQGSSSRTLSVPVEAKPLLTLAECSALTGLSRATLKGALDQGQLKARQIGRAWRVRRNELDQWLQTL